MSTALTKRQFTVEEYLALESRSELKHEYWHGEIVEVLAMSGGSVNHGRIAGDIARMVENFLVNQPCESFNSDIRVKSADGNVYVYPDVSIACQPLEIQTIDGVETLSNPVIVVEVLSSRSEARDRGKKLALYQAISSIVEYLIVSQDEVRIDHLVRSAAGWKLRIFTSLDDTVPLESIKYELRLADVYRRVQFPLTPES